MSVKEIERAKSDVILALSLFPSAFESECLPKFVKNGAIKLLRRYKVPPIKK